MLSLASSTLLEELSDGVLIIHPSGRPLYANPVARSWLGLAREASLPGDLMHRFTAAESWDAVLAGSERVELALDGIQLVASISRQDDQIVILLRPESDSGQQDTGRFEALNRISLALKAELEPERVLEIVLAESLSATGMSCGDIVLLDMVDNSRIDLVTQGCPTEMSWDVGLDLELVRRGGVYLVSDLAGAGVASGHTELRAAVAVPFQYEDSIGGVIHLYSGEPVGLDHNTKEFVQALAAQTAVAVGSAQQFQEQLARNNRLRRRAEQIAQMVKVSRVIRSEQPFEEMLNDLVQAVQESIGFNIVLLSLVEGEGSDRTMRRVAAAGLPQSVWEELKQAKPPYTNVAALLRDEFRIGDAYFIPEHRQSVYEDLLQFTYTSLEREATTESEDWHADDMFLIPLRASGGEILGVLSLDDPVDGRRPTPEATSPIKVFASQAAITIENARLLAEMRRRAAELDWRTERLSTLVDISAAISKSLDPQYIGEVISREAAAAIGVEQAGLVLLDDDGEAGRVIATHPPLPRDAQPIIIPVKGNQATESVIQTGQAVAFEDAQNHPMMASVRELMIARDVQSIMIVPLVVGGRVIGTLGLDSTQARREFIDEEISLVQTIANQAAVALENARLLAASQSALTQLEERAERLTIINQLSAKLGSTLNSQEIMDIVVHEMARITGVDQCRLVLFDSELGYGTIQAEHIPVADASVRIIPMAGNPSYDMLLETRKPLNIEDVSSNPATAVLAPRYEVDGVKSMLIVPMLVQDKLIGSVGLNVVGHHRRFSDAEVEICAIIGNQAAIALDNARLYEEVRGFTSELEERVEERTRDLEGERDRTSALLRITSELSTSLDLDRVLHRSLELVNEVIGATQGAIYLLDQATSELVHRAALIRSTPLASEGERIPFHQHEGLVGWVFEHGQSAIVSDTLTDGRHLPSPEVSAQYRSALVVPLSSSEGVVGVLMLFGSKPNAFSEPQLQLVETAALQVTTAMNNAELFKLIGEQAERLGSLMRTEQESSAKSAAILESVADGVMVVDAQGKVILFNATAERILDLERSQILGQPISEIIGLWGKAGAAWIAAIQEWTHAQDLEQSNQFLEERLEVGNKVVSVHLAPVLSGRKDNPAFLGTVSAFRDITKDVELDRMQREWVSTVSHELRTPMTSIKGYADLLMLGAAGEVSDGQARFLEVITNNADRLSLLVNDLLDISRIETGRMQLDLGAIDLYEVVGTVVDNLYGRVEQEEKSVDIQVAMSEDLPSVYGDIDRVTQILTNLLDNAFNYTPAGGSITISAAMDILEHGADEDRVKVDVIDTGIGITPEDQAKIFERFYRSDRPEVQKVSGTGLGLAIVNHLVDMHGGRLRVFSEGPGKGSTFSFTLPVAPEKAIVGE